MPNAEVPNMINIDGNDRYYVRVLSSFNVASVTLFVRGLPNKFPVKFIACFSKDDVPFQYQINTVIEGITLHYNEALDGIIWKKTPQPVVTFSPLGHLDIVCVAEFQSESTRFTDELNIYRSYLEKRPGNNMLSFVGCGKIHKDRDNFVEQSGKYIYKGTRRPVAAHRQKMLYNVSFSVLNGSLDDVGMYTCAAERARDRTYVSSWVRLAQPPRPTMFLQHCEDSSLSAPGEPLQTLVMTAARTTCIRCRAYGYMTGAEIIATKNSHLLDENERLLLDHHVNVPDGGLLELTLTFLSPSSADAGLYRCSVSNEAGSDSLQFRIIVV